jgi:hypothetical protein
MTQKNQMYRQILDPPRFQKNQKFPMNQMNQRFQKNQSCQMFQ